MKSSDREAAIYEGRADEFDMDPELLYRYSVKVDFDGKGVVVTFKGGEVFTNRKMVNALRMLANQIEDECFDSMPEQLDG